MENLVYLNKVLNFLKQELPGCYREGLSLQQEKFIVILPDNADFQQCYQQLHPLITNQISRLRRRQTDLHFTIKSRFQERDFTLFKVTLYDA